MQTDLQPNLMNAVKLVNRLLYLNVSVYWLAEPLPISVDGAEYALVNGGFIIPFYQSLSCGNILYSTVFLQYVEMLFTEFDNSS